MRLYSISQLANRGPDHAALSSFPFIYLPLFVALQKSDKTPDDFTVGTVVARWVVETILYKVIMSVVIGAVVGTAARWMLAKAWRQHMVDRDFL